MGDTECILLCWKGEGLQKFATTQFYVILFGIVGFTQFAVNSYQVAILSTVEKRFKIPSRLSGLIISGIDIGTIICVTYLVLYGSKLHKPRTVGFGIFLTALSCLFWLLPHFIYGPSSSSSGEPGSALNSSYPCELGEMADEVCEGGNEAIPSILMFVLGNVSFGIGSCFYWVLGLTYIDDSAKRSKTAFYLSLIMFIRMFGPALGFMLATYSLSINIDPSSNLTEKDPRWIGAWWLGFVFLFICLTSLVAFACAFPRYLPDTSNRIATSQTELSESNLFKDFRIRAGRLLSNKIFVFNTLSATLYVFGLIGFGTFGPKYLELQFQLTSSEASLFTGVTGLVCVGLGVLSSGLVITSWQPSGERIALWNVLCEALEVIAFFGFAFLGCPAEHLQGHLGTNNQWDLRSECNEKCACPPTVQFSPLCSQTGDLLFFSPCHAGCLTGSLNHTSQYYEGCECEDSAPLAPGSCPVSEACRHQFYSYFGLLCLLTFLSASGRAGNTLLQFRSVKEEDKAVSIAVTEGFMSIFAFIPSPIIFGLLLDYTCIVWGESCGRSENCWLYDGKSMRYLLNFTTFAFLLLGTLADVVVWVYSGEVEIYEAEEERKEDEHAMEVLLTSPTS